MNPEVKNISVILPTKGNPDGVCRLLESITQTSLSPQDVEIVLYADKDDIKSYDIAYPALSFIKLIDPSDTVGNVIRACFTASRGRYIMLLRDDAVFRTKNWDRAVCDALGRFSDGIGMAYGNDLINGKKLASFPVLSRTACELMDSICPPEYVMSFVDRHIYNIFRQLSRLGHRRAVYLPNIVIECIKAPETQLTKNSTVDEMVFVASDEYRNYIACKLAQYIEDRRTES